MTEDRDAAELEISVVNRIVTLLVRGRVRAEQIRLLRDRLRAQPGLAAAPGVLVDLQAADLDRVGAEDVRRFAADESLLARDQKLAIVVSGPFGYGLGRMFEQLRAGRTTVRVFQTRDEADAWLTRAD